MDGHFAGGEGAGFVEADGVNAGEGLDGIEILDEDFLLAETDGGKGKDGGGEENESLWDHVDEGGDSAGDSRLGGGAIDAETRPQEEGADGDKGETDVFDDVIHEGEEFGVGGLDGVGAVLQLGEGAVLPDCGDGGFTGAGNDETARDEGVAGVLSDTVLFASDERLIDLYSSLFYLAIYENLVAEREDGEVAFD